MKEVNSEGEFLMNVNGEPIFVSSIGRVINGLNRNYLSKSRKQLERGFIYQFQASD